MEIQLRDYQIKGKQELAHKLVQGYRKVVFQLSTGGGKCLAKNTPILMYDGHIKKVQDVVAGDVLMGPDSLPRNVLSTCTGREMMYKITPKKGDSYIVNESHILSLKMTNHVSNGKSVRLLAANGKKYLPGDIANISVTDYLKSSKTFKHCAKGWKTGVNFNNNNKLDMPPYILGIWLGDGTSLKPEITSVDKEVINEFTKYSIYLGNTINKKETRNRCPVYVSSRTKGSIQKNPFTEKLEDINVLGNKHIPFEYKTASYEDRIQLLSGLLDTDGYYDKKGYEIVTKFEQLGIDILFLARSLGFYANGRWCKKKCTNTGAIGDYFRINIYGDVDKIPCKVPHKIASPRKMKKNVLMHGISVEPIGEGYYYGFEIDGDRLFMLGDFTVTHNTVLFSAISKGYIKNSQNSIVIAVHRKELLKQTRDTLYQKFGIDCELIKAGVKYIKPSRIYVCMVESLIKRIPKIPTKIGMVIIDECHINSFNKIHEHFPAYNGSTTDDFPGTGEPYIIGFTATPLNATKKDPMKNHYQEIVCGIDIQELIRIGSLVQNITHCPKDTVDRAGLKIKNGEFDETEMSQQFSKPKFIQNTVEAYKRYSMGTKAIVFNCSIDHSIKVNNAFRIAGFKAKHLDSNMKGMERDRIINWFENTPGAILNNVGIATTGTDIPSIETIIVNKSTLSMPLWIQMAGRGARPYENKTMFSIIDMGGNAAAHDDWNAPRDWYDIFHNPPKSKDKEGVAPVKSCPECDAIIHASAMTCKYCGYIFPAKEAGIEEELGEFVIVTKNIDVHALIQTNREKKQYYTFYRIGKDLAKNAKNTIPKMTDESANFILQKYEELAQEWCLEYKKKLDTWHKNQLKENLFSELMKAFPDWKPEGWEPAPPPVPISPQQEANNIPLWREPQQQENPFYIAPIKTI